jgi:hypothetical protein
MAVIRAQQLRVDPHDSEPHDGYSNTRRRKRRPEMTRRRRRGGKPHEGWEK